MQIYTVSKWFCRFRSGFMELEKACLRPNVSLQFYSLSLRFYNVSLQFYTITLQFYNVSLQFYIVSLQFYTLCLQFYTISFQIYTDSKWFYAGILCSGRKPPPHLPLPCRFIPFRSERVGNASVKMVFKVRVRVRLLRWWVTVFNTLT